MKSKVIFRVDVANHIGTGHLQRCLTLARVFQDNNWEITFAMIGFDLNALLQVEKEGFLVVKLSMGESVVNPLNSSSWLSKSEEMDAAEFISAIKDDTYTLCIVDHYSLSEKWEKIIATIIPVVMVIDDLADRAHYCSFLLDQNYFFNFQNRYNSLVPEHTVKLLGPKYALLRKEFYELRVLEKKLSAQRDKIQILCNFGGIANFCLLNKLIYVATKFSSINFIIVAGNITEDDFKILTELVGDLGNIQLLEYSNNISRLMKESDFCFGACGSTVWERFCLGLNSALVSVAENQVELLQFLDEENLIDNLGDASTLTVKILKDYLSGLDIESSNLIARKHKIMGLVDGKGAKRVYSEIQENINVKR